MTQQLKEWKGKLHELEQLYLLALMKKTPVDPWLFLTGYEMGDKWTPGPSKGLVWTLDEHDKKNPIKRFPNKKYLWQLTRLWLCGIPIQTWAKSRQILVTWLLSALHLHLYLFNKGQLIFFQSKKETDSNENVKRAQFIYDHLPEIMQQMYPVYKYRNEWPYLRIEALRSGPNEYSRIIGIPQGADVLRQYTASAVFSDETAFQEKGEESYTAMKPTIDGGGRATFVSSANGKEIFYRLYTDDLDGGGNENRDYIEPIKGIRVYKNKSGSMSVRAHYSADPLKDPDTAEGRAWYNRTRPGYSTEAWEREMEINFSMGGGSKMYNDFNRSVHCNPLKYNPCKPLYRAWDFGYHHPANLFAQINDLDQLLILGELQGDDIALPDFKIISKEYAQSRFPEMKAKTDDEIKHIKTRDFHDPEGDDVQDMGKSLSAILKAFPYRVISRSQKLKKTVAMEFVRKLLLKREDGRPGMIIDDRYCPILVEGFEGGYHSRKNDPDKPEEDGYYEHTQDCLLILVANLFRKLGLLRKKEMKFDDKMQKKTKVMIPMYTRSYNKVTGY